MPPLTARHLYDWLMEIGPTEAGSMGQIPISWQAIDAWMARTFVPASADDVRLLRRLSREYLSELKLAEDRNRPAPWWPTRAEADPVTEEQRLRAVLG